MLLMETLVYGFADRSIQQHYSSALNKVKAVLGSAQKEKLITLNENMKLQVPSCLSLNFEYLSVLQQAISSRNIIEVDYKNNKEEVSRRRVEAIGLIFYALNWHLIGWCHVREDYRDFRVSRILKLKDTGQLFTKNDHILLDDYMKTLPVGY